MAFTDIEAYPQKMFKRYWRQLLRDPRFVAAIESVRQEMNKHAPKPRLKIPRNIKLTREFRKSLFLRVSRFNDSAKDWLSAAKKLTTWMDFRKLTVKLVSTLLQRTTHGLTWIFEAPELFQDKTKGLCFLSNHRSTSLDPMFTNYILLKNFSKGCYNAAGDNIFQTPWLGRLIRLNQGFIVKRTVEDPDEKINEAEKLSSYIKGLIKKKQWVWIAHRNGRSKDGSDKTDSAVLSMLKMSSPDTDWSAFSQDFTLCPVSISWELIPLDLSIALEQAGLTSETDPNRDMKNILGEIIQQKGRVHVTFGKPVQADKRSQLVKNIDLGIHSNLRLWESNYLAYSLVHELSDEEKALLTAQIDLSKGSWVLDRAAKIPEAARQTFLEMYAAPVTNALQIEGSLAAVLNKQTSLIKRSYEDKAND